MVKKIIYGIFAIVGLFLTFGSEGAYNSTFNLDGEGQESITLSHMSWDDSLAATAVITNVLRDEGFDVNLVQLDPAFIFSSLATGDSDVSVNPWLPITHGSFMEEYGENLDVMGPNTEGAQMALVVPTYMEDVESIEDLSDQANQTITGIEPGAGLSEQIETALGTYDNLSDWEHHQSSTGAMLTELRQAYNNQEEIVIGGWTPHWKFIEFDLKMLEDPLGAFGDGEGIYSIAREGFKEDNPVAYQIIDNFSWSIDDVQQVMLYLQEGMSPDAAGRRWIEENPEKVNEWTEGIETE